MQDKQFLSALLTNMETEMRELGWWSHVPPSIDAFESEVPFFLDTMDFPEWLQWVFIARFRAILEDQHPLPAQCYVAPMAEEWFKDVEAYTDPLLMLIRRFDEIVNAM